MSPRGEPASRGRPAGRPLTTARVVPRWVGIAFAAAAALLGPWTVWVLWTLPDRHLANHWALAWGGFDAGLAAALAATGVTVLRRSAMTPIAASVAATMLVCDAWFDVLTSHGNMTVALAAVEALLGELPLAAVCFWIAVNVETVLADGRPYLERAGFRVVHRRLLPPEDGEDVRLPDNA
jgi:hypothetical protein